jgi:diguanylate cyclase (GGDEF)-like protein
MQSQIRQMDVLGRYGGEEFVMAFPAAGIDEALQIGQRIVNAVRNTQLELDGHRFNVTVSGGIASGGVTIHESLESILLKADKALYMAKENGRDMVVAYQSMNANKEKT